MSGARELRDSWTQYAEQHGLFKEAEAPAPEPKRAKYGNVKTVRGSVTFDSAKEAARFDELKLREAAGEIAELGLQPLYPLHVVKLHRSSDLPIDIATVASYRADFTYLDLRTGEYFTEDVKSVATRTPLYILKRKIVEAVHGLTITEV